MSLLLSLVMTAGLCACAPEEPVMPQPKQTAAIAERPKPGEDFYEYVNYDFLTTAQVPYDSKSYTRMDQINEELEKDISAIVDRCCKDGKTADETQIKTLYEQYMDIDAREAVGVTPLMPIAAMIEQCNTTDELIAAMGMIYQEYGVSSFFNFEIKPDMADAGVKVNGNKLNYNSSYSYISYANAGDCIVSSNTIQFYTSSLSEGENTVTFTNPDGEDVSVRLSMSKTGDYWSGYSYTVDVLGDDEQETDNDAETGFVIDLKTVAADASTSAYTVATFGNEYSDLTRIASAGVLVNGTKLNYNSSYSSLYYVNTGDCIVTGKTIQFHSSLLIEGENTVTFSNPDGGENKVVRLKMSKVEVPPKYWYESTSYDYVIEVIEDEPQPETFTVTWKNGNTILETDKEVEKNSSPVYDGVEPVKDADDEFIYTFAGWSAAD